jgi:hypothetical protein
LGLACIGIELMIWGLALFHRLILRVGPGFNRIETTAYNLFIVRLP